MLDDARQMQSMQTSMTVSHDNWHQDIVATTAGVVLSHWQVEGMTIAGSRRRDES